MAINLDPKLLDELLSNINHVLFVRDAFSENHDIIYLNDNYESLWGLTKQSLIDNPASYIESIHPEDREMFLGLYMEFLEDNLEYEIEFRIVRPDGSIRWIFGKVFPIFNAEGEIYRIAGFAEDITGRKENEININRLNNVQSGVLKMLAHDLRTPIAGIKLTAGLIETTSSDLVNECSSRIIDCCDNTLLMMDDLLSHIQMSSTGVELSSTPGVLEDELKTIYLDFKVQISQKNLKIILPDTQTKLEFDVIKFRQIITNLLSNAIKFSHPGGLITISVLQNASSIDLVVNDQGVGIPSGLLPEVFDIFTRARSEGTIGEKSTGLGLSITKRLVEMHNGSIVISSIPNEGTEVRVSFPA